MRVIKITLILFLMLILFFSHKTGFFSIYAQESPEEIMIRQYYNTGRQYYEQGKYKEAQREFQKALSIVTEGKKAPGYLERIPERGAGEKQTQPEYPPLLYTIGIGDVLFISVWQEDKLSQEVTVRPDGMISFPLVGDIQAAGRTIPQLDEEITNRLKEYIRYPQVSITVQRLGGKKIIVLGEVIWPGVYYVTGTKTVLEAIALAGGFNNHAVPSSTIVIRKGPKKLKGIRVNLSRAIMKPDMRQNIVLEAEDIVYVPKKFIANLNYFISTFMYPLSSEAERATTYRNYRW